MTSCRLLQSNNPLNEICLDFTFRQNQICYDAADPSTVTLKIKEPLTQWLSEIVMADQAIYVQMLDYPVNSRCYG